MTGVQTCALPISIASIWLRKYAWIFVLGRYLFLEAHSFPRASLSENCSLLGTDNVRGQISGHIFAPNEGYCLYIGLTEKLQQLQNRAARIVTLSNYETRSKDLLDDLGCEVLVERRMGKVANLMYK